MSFFSSIGKALKSVVSVAAPVVGTIFGGPAGGAIGTAIGGAIGGGSRAQTIPASSQFMGLPQGTQIPRTAPGPVYTPPTRLPTPGVPGSTSSGGFLGGLASGLGLTAGGGRQKRGKLTGNAIPVGFHERMSPAGVVYLARARRRRGISARDVSAYRRVDRLIHRISARSHSGRFKKRS